VSSLIEVEVKEGDSFLIKPGTVHAIGANLTLIETQQNSNITYRFYDWGRVGLDGQPRELHIEDSLSVIDYKDSDIPKIEPVIFEDRKILAASPYFIVEEISFSENIKIKTENSFCILYGFKNQASVKIENEDYQIDPLINAVIIPQNIASFAINSSGPNTCLKCSLPVGKDLEILKKFGY